MLTRKATLALALVGALATVLLNWVRDPIRLRPGEHRGVDVSAHQGKIDWPTLAPAGTEFAYIKPS